MFWFLVDRLLRRTIARLGLLVHLLWRSLVSGLGGGWGTVDLLGGWRGLVS